MALEYVVMYVATSAALQEAHGPAATRTNCLVVLLYLIVILKVLTSFLGSDYQEFW